MQMSIGLDRLKRFVCLLLIFVLLFCFFMCPRASAVALEATTVAYAGLLVGTLLVGAGVAFSNPGDMAKAGNAMYRTLQKGNEAIASKIAAISVWAVEHGKSIGSAALRIGKDLYQGIVDTFNASYSGGKFEISPSVSAAQDFVAANRSAKTFYIHTYYFDRYGDYDLSRGKRWYKVVCSVDKTSAKVQVNDLTNGSSVGGVSYGVNGVISSCYLDTKKSGDYTYLAYRVIGTYSDGDPFNSYQDFKPYIRDDFFELSTAAPFSVPCSGDLAYPSDNYLVRMPDIPSVDTATGEVTYPDSIAYTKDAVAAPYPIGDDGVKVPDIPFDIPVDQTSGKPMDDTGTDTDTPSKPGEGTDTDKPSDSVNWPSAGDISLPKLIISKFPFCIPFDVARLIGLLEADPKTPIFHVPLKVGTILNEEIVLDLSQWDNAVRIIRWGELIVFVAGLVLVTRNYIKW